MIKVILLIVLILINGLFSASEIAFLSIDKYELESQIKKGNKKAKKVLNIGLNSLMHQANRNESKKPTGPVITAIIKVFFNTVINILSSINIRK